SDETSKFRRAFVAYGVAVFVVALLVRLIFVVQSLKNPFFTHRLIDEIDYHVLATRFRAGIWPSAEAYFRPPLYPLFLGAVYAVAGDAVVDVKLVQVALGALAAPLTLVIATRATGQPRVGLAAGLVAALMGPLVYYDAQL